MIVKTAAFCIAMSFATIAAAVPTIYTDEAVFDAAITGVTNTSFTFTGAEFAGTSYTLGLVTFSSTGPSNKGSIYLQSYNDAYGVPSGVVPYLGDYGKLLTIDSTTSGLGLHLGSYGGTQTVTYTVDGVTGTLSVPRHNSTTFIGFTDFSPIHATFTNSSELDTIRFTTGSGAVPEPMTWALLGIGFGFIGVVSRHRRTPIPAA